MTAEIAILNKEAVALAADSAVAITKHNKIFKSANKLYSLSKHQPIGIMIYGNPHFIGVPWETIIKLFRNDIANKQSSHLKECGDMLICFLQKFTRSVPKTVQSESMLTYIEIYFEAVRDELISSYDICPVNSDQDVSSTGEFTSIIRDVLLPAWQELETIVSSVDHDEFLKFYDQNLEDIISRVFKDHEINNSCKLELKEIAFYIFTKIHDSVLNYTGVVIAGFGDDEIFPSVEVYSIAGAFDDRLKYCRLEDKCVKIDYAQNSKILAFAQDGIVNRFIQGIDPLYLNIIERYMSDHLPDDPACKIGLLDELKREIRTNFISVENVVANLPKAEIAELAESLVNITSLNKKVTMQAETVSGPIDVAIITKGDGLIWIKRKHYFDAKLNPQYFTRYLYDGSIRKYKKEIYDGEEDADEAEEHFT